MASFQKEVQPHPSTISIFFGHVTPYSKDDLIQKEFEEDLTLFIAKELMSLSFVEAPFFNGLILKQNPHFNFPLRRILVNDILLRMVELTKDKYVFSSLESCHSCPVSFDPWMSKFIVDTFVTIMHFLNAQWEPCHIIVGIFETAHSTGSAMVLQANDVLAKRGFIT